MFLFSMNSLYTFSYFNENSGEHIYCGLFNKKKKKMIKLSNSPSEVSEHVQQQKGWLHGSFLAIKVCVGQEKDKDTALSTKISANDG